MIINSLLSGEGGIDALKEDNPILESSLDLLNLCSGQFGSSAAESGGFGGTAPDSGGSGGRVTVQDISFNLASSPDLHGQCALLINLQLKFLKGLCVIREIMEIYILI